MDNSSIIYHYTNISGLIGIITSHTIWASDCRFLNDGTELTYAQELFLKEVNKLKLPAEEENIRQGGGGYNIADLSHKSSRVFISCFCEDGDLLSQWRGYGVDQGYAIGFDIEQLRALKIGRISPVHYGLDKPKEYFAEELEQAPQRTGHPGVHGYYLYLKLLPRLAIIKHPGFAEEREWRFLKQISKYDPNLDGPDEGLSINFRSSSLGPIPYIAIPFHPECLREVIVGPGSYIDTRVDAIAGLLEVSGYTLNVNGNFDIRISTIPYRK
jgi:hypothetical protein